MKLLAALLLVPVLAFAQSGPNTQLWKEYGIGGSAVSKTEACGDATYDGMINIKNKSDELKKEGRVVRGTMISECKCSASFKKDIIFTCVVDIGVIHTTK
jgi:hypothetical protein